MCFFVEYLDKTDLRGRWIWGPPSQKIGKKKPKSQMKDPESIAGKTMV